MTLAHAGIQCGMIPTIMATGSYCSIQLRADDHLGCDELRHSIVESPGGSNVSAKQTHRPNFGVCVMIDFKKLF
jgi:hypothetical protein